jgi:hypothetical protein
LENNNGEVLQRLTRLETKMDMIITVKDTAFEALQSTRSAHKRIDDIERLIHNMEEVIKPLSEAVIVTKDKADRHDKYLFWATTSGLFGFIGLILSIYSIINSK